MAEYTIYHNPRCTPSRATLESLREHRIGPTIVGDRQDPPAAAVATEVVAERGSVPEALVRKSEEIYKSKYAGKSLTAPQWIAAMVKDPILIERPIVGSGKR